MLSHPSLPRPSNNSSQCASVLELSVETQVIAETGPLRFQLWRNLTWTILAYGVQAVSTWGVLVVLAKSGTPELVGIYALGLSIATPVFLLTNCQLRGIYISDVEQTHRWATYLRARAVTTVGGLAAIVLIAAMSTSSGTGLKVLILVGLLKALDAAVDIYHGYFQKVERLDTVAQSQGIRAIGIVLAVGAVMIVTHNLSAAITGAITASALVFIFFDLRRFDTISRRSPDQGSKRHHSAWSPEIATAIWFAAPMGIVSVLMSLLSYIPRYLVAHSQGDAGLGIFAASAYVLTAGTLLMDALGQSALAELSRKHASGNHSDFAKMTARFCGAGIAVGVVICFVLWTAAAPFLNLVYRPEYAQSANVLKIAMLALPLLNVAYVLRFALTAARVFAAQLVVLSGAAATSLVAGALLIPRYGLTGGAMTIVVSAFVLAISYTAVFAQHIVKSPAFASEGA